MFGAFWKKAGDDESSGEEVTDNSAIGLSHVAEAAYDELRKHHNHHHHELWNVTHAKVVGDVQFTPKDAFTRTDRSDPVEGHDDWFAPKVLSVMKKTQFWCDVLSLAPPDGAFMEETQSALKHIVASRTSLGMTNTSSRTKQKIIIRMMFGNLPLTPTDCNRLIKEMTEDLPPNAKDHIHIWIGSWRKDASWNHSKIIAVDGKYLWTGGHNFWDRHYLREKPVNDLSIEMEGGTAADAHRFANAQWGYIVKKQATGWGRWVDNNVPDTIELPRRARVTVSEFPIARKAADSNHAAEFPPFYKHKKELSSRAGFDPDYVKCITMGRYGTLLKKARPSDDAFVAMLKSAKQIIRLSLQDLGPPTVQVAKQAVPGLTWPHRYLNALATVIWERGVDVEIVLSNPKSIPDNLSPMEACYGNGWTCVDVAAEIIKKIIKHHPEAKQNPGKLRAMVEDNLRVCFLRSPQGTRYKDGQTLGLHSKHFIIDDVATYIGSQNLYMCDLAEWGVLIDDKKVVNSIKEQYWDPMWKNSFKVDDCEVDKVMDGLEVSREAENQYEMTKLQLEQAKLEFHGKMHRLMGDKDTDSEAEC